MTNKTPFMSIVLFNTVRNGDLAEVERLLDAGADVGARDIDGRTPLDFACDLPESDPTREPLLEIFRDRFPEAWFTKFCESPGRMPGRGM